MSVTLPEYSHSNFPDEIDTKYELANPTAETWPYLNQYETYVNSGDFTAANQYLVSHPEIIKHILTLDLFLSWQDGLLATQKTFRDKVETYMANLQNALTSETFGQATTTTVGVVQLSSVIDSTDETMAATPKAVSSAVIEAKYITKADGTKYIWGVDDTGIYYQLNGDTTKIYIAKQSNVDEKIDIPDRITTGTTITLADNTEYDLTNVTSLTLTYPAGNFECWLRITTASSGTITITLPTSTYIGYAPTFGNGETWELSIKDSVVIAQQVGDGQ